MKIVVKTNDLKRNININLPMCMITTILRFTNISSSKYVDKNKINSNFLTEFNKENLIKGLKYLRKNHKGLILVEVDSPNGEYVKIKI
ncbi:hypothetical protein JGS6364_13221 [[Clostridium] sordellii]|uniref:hypothetical protein n=1 Tax=Paraclostridium sordellii TaxID=1505 RepID=UPI0002FC4A63|nr:hypothetical protein [Paeniclostridium sordellii]TAN67828.1 hypothetical protein WS9_007125 [Paeniclostridium sordellii 8483]CEK30676.1 hypothetical protein JGS6364_13221 [[Clostridium] sordellii] [Paeniclostridium sordellii]